MTTAVETTITAIIYIVQVVPIGTNISLVHLLWAMVNGSFLSSRGAVHSALSASELSDDEIRRSWSALRYGSWCINEILAYWHAHVAATNEWQVRRYEGYRVKSIDITGFFRPHLQGKVTKHYSAAAQRALPAMVFGVMITSGVIKGKRVPRLDQVVRCPVEKSEAEFKAQLLTKVQKALLPDEIAVVDGGFGVFGLQEAKVKRYVVREAVNCTALKNVLPAYKGRGTRPKYGELIRPLARKRLDHVIAASVPEQTGAFAFQGRIRYHAWHNLVTPKTKVAHDNLTCSIFVFFDPFYKKPLVLATDMAQLKAESVYLIYRDRWPVEHPPLAAKQMIGLHRQFVSTEQSCFRLPELALLAGNLLTHCAAILPPAPSGFWDRAPKPTPGRLRRQLSKAIFPNLLDLDPLLRKKNSHFHHLPRGADATRSQPPISTPAFTGN